MFNGYTNLEPAGLKAWEDFQKKGPPTWHDPCFSPFYLGWNRQIEGGQALALHYQATGGGALWMNLILRSLPSKYGVKGYDVISPYGYGGPLILGDPETVWAEFDPLWADYCQSQGIVCEFQRFHALLQNQKGAPPAYRVEGVKPVVWVDLSGNETDILNRMHPNKRADIKLSVRKNVELVDASPLSPAESKGQLKQFWDLYQAEMQRKDSGTFYRFGDTLLSEFQQALEDGNLWLINAYQNEAYAGGLLALPGHYTSHYFLASANATGRFCQSAVACLWTVLKKAQQFGSQRFHLGGGLAGGADAEQDSLFRFKHYFAPANTLFYTVGTRIHDPRGYEQLKKACEQQTGQKPLSDRLMFYR